MSWAVLGALLLLLGIPVHAELTHITCGGRGDRPCTVGDDGWWLGGLGADGCDRGLQSKYIGYCAERASWWPHPCIKFRNPWQCDLADHPLGSDDGRRDKVDDYASALGWGLEAYQRQLELGRNEPINWVNMIGTHNAYNNKSDGYLIPNQTHSLTEQLEFGARVLALDVHQTPGTMSPWISLKLSHVPTYVVGYPMGLWAYDRHLIYGLREIREWLRDNPSGFVILGFESYLGDDAYDPGFAQAEFRIALAAELGPYLLRKGDKPANRWPTLAEMRANGTRAIVLADNDAADNEYVHYKQKPLTYGKGSDPSMNRAEWPLPTNDLFTHFEEDHLRTVFYDTCTHEEGMGMICPHDEPCEKAPAPLFNWCTVDRVISLRQLVNHGFTTYSFDRWMGEETRTQSEPHDVDKAWAFDDLVWTWRKGVRGWEIDNMAAALSAADGRWYAANLEQQKHFACAYPREGEPAEWEDFKAGRGPNTRWSITTQTGGWKDGWMACAAEFGSEGLVFSVPANSWQNRDLFLHLEAVGDVWLAYRDTDEALGAGHITWDVDRGFGGSGINANPSPAREGEPVRFEANWSFAELVSCGLDYQPFDTISAGDQWNFGDGTTAAGSNAYGRTADGVRFVRQHTYRDNVAVAVVTHRLPIQCADIDRARVQSVLNVAPLLRTDCDVWDDCPATVDRSESLLWAGKPTELRAAYFDPGAGDDHEGQVHWGDGSTSAGTLSRSAQRTDVAMGTLSATHTYNTCGSFRIDVSIADDDGGSGTEYRIVQVDDPPPEITCPADVVAEGTGPAGTAVSIGQPTVAGGVCAAVLTSNNAPGLYPLGLTEVVWTARNTDQTLDGDSGEYVNLEDSCTQKVTVVDTTPPTILSLLATPSILWPPNKTMRPVTIQVQAQDIVDGSPTCSLSDVQVNQSTPGGKPRVNPFTITGASTCALLADRNGSDGARTYTLLVNCTDFSGNSVTGSTDVSVPHDSRSTTPSKAKR